MNAFDERHRQGRYGTDIPSFQAVQDAVTRIIRRQWGGWSRPDQEDLHQLVMTKYFANFGRDRLPDGDDGSPMVPTSWLNTVVKNAGIDFHRQQEARPADAADFQGDDAAALEWLLHEVQGGQSLSSGVARDVDARQVLGPALKSLEATHPMDLKLIVWRYIEDRDLHDIAKILGKSDAATKIAIRRAVGRLKERLAQG